jgi:hypothetical protein
MARDDLTNREIGLLLVLIAQGEKISNKELRERFNLVLDGKERRILNDLNLIESGTEPGHGNFLFHDVTEKGWARGRAELAARKRAQTTIPASMLFALTESIDRYLTRAGVIAADFFRPNSPAQAATEPAIEATERLAAVNIDDIELAVRTAYTKLAHEPGEWVRLAKVRPLLGDASRSEVDRTLLRLASRPDVRIAPDENQRSLTEADRNAAIRIGDHDNHLLLIGSA